jgi:carboxylesterase type B
MQESKKSLQPLLFFPASRLRLGSEDCLYLNIFTPPVEEAAPVKHLAVKKMP